MTLLAHEGLLAGNGDERPLEDGIPLARQLDLLDLSQQMSRAVEAGQPADDLRIPPYVEEYGDPQSPASQEDMRYMKWWEDMQARRDPDFRLYPPSKNGTPTPFMWRGPDAAPAAEPEQPETETTRPSNWVRNLWHGMVDRVRNRGARLLQYVDE